MTFLKFSIDLQISLVLGCSFYSTFPFPAPLARFQSIFGELANGR